VARAFDIKHIGELFRVELSGIVDGPIAEQLEGELGRRAGLLPPRSFTVLFVLVGAIEITRDAGMVLARLQRQLASCARRTAYVDRRPSMRALARWVVNWAEDGNANPVLDENQALRWLASATLRKEEQILRMERR
jgi:hypothetical protein